MCGGCELWCHLEKVISGRVMCQSRNVDSDPRNEFDGLLGFAKMQFRKVSRDFENGLFGWD
jgi:hypothetical protein